ncbi:mechanosensitive ion channel family protein [Metallosphaera hakonensis]|uniref:Mechanosensitive ion channel family protein n=1 Tax=Metallosphaera hakonensis JCM 8857 = DSM 7519 TaxID=1293036 RepID=A0A2U9IRR8_9CREN|nr:mechanosensitive ion channel family protein [Metallosphaera hakonensis]AWR98730.1 mechanosensitive ion channel [Metallosphaera hakonensis JCM 8857 = DSM 7519]
MSGKESRILAITISSIIAMILIGSAIYVLGEMKVLPGNYILYLEIAIWVVGILAVTYLLSLLVKRRLANSIGIDNASSLGFVIRVIGYALALAGVLSAFKVGLGEALAAGGFAGLVLGLASQDVLSNVFGGIMLLLSRPYKVGQRITVSTWQYGLDFPTYSPKYYSNDYLIPGYTGKVVDISLLYTIIETDELAELKIPNSIMIQAAIFVHDKNERRKVRTRYEISKDLDPDAVIEIIREEISKMDDLIEPPTVRILEATQTSFVLGIDVISRSIYEEPVRSEVIKRVTRVIKSMTTQRERIKETK